MPDEITDEERRDAATYIVSEYEDANLTREQANAMVLEQWLDAGLNAEGLEAAVAPFRQMLDDIDATRNARASPARSQRRAKSPRRKSRERGDAEDGSGDSSSSDSGSEGNGKWPWSRKEKIVDPEVAKTIKLRRKFRGKLEKAKNAIVTSVGAPVFPEALWTAVLKHGYVDFDKLNGSHFHAVNEEEGQTASIGDYTIGLKTKSATKPVTTSTDWIYCYGTYERAVCWAFGHRKKELREYFDKFHQLFRSYATTAHIRLINLDRAIRNEVASSSTLKLTDETLFSRLREQYLSIDGAGYQASGSSNLRPAGRGSSSGGGSQPRTKVRDPCRQWNHNRCSRPEDACLFLHQCMECNGDHRKLDCPQTKTGGGGRVVSTRR
jgi:hypothetical protein